jgi:CDP-diacylglycerol--serine O-phosphatidyltransferase
MKKIYLLPNVITAFGLSCGLFVIFKMAMMGVGDVDEATLLATTFILILAALADLFDGAVARAMKVESSFGGFFDSLADAITFGVAPSVVVLKTLSIETGTNLSFWLASGAMVYSICGVLRLVRFSTSPKSEETKDLAGKKNFTGIPIPAAAGGIISANLFLSSTECKSVFSACGQWHAYIMIFIFFFLGYFMISQWKFPSFKTLHIRVKSFQHVFATVVGTVLIFYGILYYFAVVLLIVSWGYLLVGLSLSLVRLIAGKRVKALADFDPEPEEDFE